MRIGIDSHAAEQDGTGNCTYYRNLLLQLSAIDQTNEYILFATDPKHPFYQELKDRANFKIVGIAPRPAWFRVFVSLCAATYRMKIDVLHVQYFAPFFHKGSLVTTVHDLTSYHFPEFFSFYERILFKTILPWTCHRTEKILTASEVSKQDLVRLLRVPENKVSVSLCGVSEEFLRDQSEDDVQFVRNRYGLDGKYLLYVGRIDPRKNLIRLIQAFTQLRSNFSVDHKLVIIGKVYLEPQALPETLRKSPFQKDIRFCGYVPDEHLPALYKGADVFAYTSEYEGFGLPPLEAMAAGTPVVASDIAISREILSDAAVLVNPRDTDAIANGIHKIISDKDFSEQLSEKGRERALQFQWVKVARMTLQAYEAVYKQTS